MLLIMIHACRTWKRLRRVFQNWNIDCAFVLSFGHTVSILFLEIWTNRIPDMFDLPPEPLCLLRSFWTLTSVTVHTATTWPIPLLSEYLTVQLWPVAKWWRQVVTKNFSVHFSFNRTLSTYFPVGRLNPFVQEAKQSMGLKGRKIKPAKWQKLQASAKIV